MSNEKEAKDFRINRRARFSGMFHPHHPYYPWKSVCKIRKKLTFFFAYSHFKYVFMYLYFYRYFLETHTPLYIFLRGGTDEPSIVISDKFYGNIRRFNGYRTCGVLWEQDVKRPWERLWYMEITDVKTPRWVRNEMDWWDWSQDCMNRYRWQQKIWWELYKTNKNDEILHWKHLKLFELSYAGKITHNMLLLWKHLRLQRIRADIVDIFEDMDDFIFENPILLLLLFFFI